MVGVETTLAVTFNSRSQLRRSATIAFPPVPDLPMAALRSRLSLMLACSIVGLSACSLKPVLAPTAAGCYSVSLDSFPDVFSKMLVPRPPELIRLDSAFGGLLQVPAAWLEAAGFGMRGASLVLLRPPIVIRDMRLVTERGMGAFPQDSLALTFGAGGPNLNALFRADASGDWFGLAYVVESPTREGLPIVPIQLRRQVCGPTRMAISRTF